MAESKNYTLIIRKQDGTTFGAGGVMAADDDHAIIEIAKAIRSKTVNEPGISPDDLVIISTPDGCPLGMPATIAEFLKK